MHDNMAGKGLKKNRKNQNIQMKRKLFLAAAAAVLFAANVCAQEDNPSWLRKNCISPDGSRIAFCYQGDIFVVDSDGGRAVQITSNPSYDTDPLWTPDSKSIVFSSYREGGKDIFITSAEGGVPKRITNHPGSETPICILDNGDIVYFANIMPDAEYSGFPGTAQIYVIGQDGGRPHRVTSLPIADLSVNDDGAVIYEDIKGYEDNFRKHHTSSVTRDIWLYVPSADEDRSRFSINGDGVFTKLSSFNGEDRNPVFCSDNNSYYYLSEKNGSFNIYKGFIDNPDKSVQLTYEKDHPVRYLSVSDNGILAYSYNGDLYTLREGQKPEKVGITLVKDQNEKKTSYTSVSSGVTSLAVSPNGKEVAVVIRGDVYVASVDYSLTRRITNTPEQERNVSFSKDGRTLYYSAERDGHWGIYATSLTEKNDKYFTLSIKMKEELVTSAGETCFQPQVSPDGKWLGFLRDRTEIVIKNIKNGKEKSLLKNVNYSYTDGDQSFEWSPDSRYILCNYQGDGGWNNEDVALIDIESGEITNITESGYTDTGFRWAMKGKAMTWMSDRAGYRSHGSWGAEMDVYVMFFDGKEYMKFLRDEVDEGIEKMLGEESKSRKKDDDKEDDKSDSTKVKDEVEKIVLDLENRKDRTVRLTRFSGMMGDNYLSNDGKKLYYIARGNSGYDLYVLDIESKSVKVVSSNTYGSIYPDAEGKYFYMVGNRGISRYDVASGNSKNIPVNGDFEYRPEKEREYIFNHVWKQVAEKFYDPDIHGIDWEGYRENYRRFLPYIDNNFDFQELLSEMLGELNGSHTGARYSVRSGITMGSLGVLYDDDYEGDGLKIQEVLKGGVLNIADPEIKAGDIITAIDGTEIKAGQEWYSLLAKKAGKKILIAVSKNGRKPVEMYIEPAYSDYAQLYRRWVKNNERLVEKLSGGRVGYVHVAGMDSESFREVYSQLLGKYRSCDAVIVDTRHNGGGWLHDDLATLLAGKPYIRFEPRGQYIGTEPYNKWNKPSCVLIGEDNYSDASGFPYVYKTLGIGKLVGAPVPGTMTAVWWETQIDPSLVFGIPQVGSVGIKEGRYLENMQVEPDIEVYNDPASVLRGEDKQLEAAVEEMLKEISGNEQ